MSCGLHWCPSMRQSTAHRTLVASELFWRPIVPIHSKQCSRKANLNWHNAVLIGICIQLRLQRYTGQGRQTAKQNQANGSIYFVLLLPQEHSLYISFIVCCIVPCLCLFFYSLDQCALHWLSSPSDTHQFDFLLLITPHSALFVFTAC